MAVKARLTTSQKSHLVRRLTVVVNKCIDPLEQIHLTAA